jgi:phospholipase/carboxylesterase
MTSMTTELLPAIEIETAPHPACCVIWLHGLGADGNDFVPIIEALGLSGLGVRFIFPHAPTRPVTINDGYVMRAWYDIGYEDLSLKEDERGVRESQAAIEALIEREHSRGIGYDKLVLAGFSQGGAIALHLGLRESRRLGGIVALSTYLPLAVTLPSEKSAASEGLPIFLAHGRSDPLIPIELAEATRRVLEREGYSVEWHVYPMPHSVCVDEIGAIGAWLTRLARAGGS